MDRAAVLSALALLAVAATACSSGPAPPPAPDVEARRAGWEQWKEARDELMRSPESPFPAEQRPAFTALPYFDYDPDFLLGLTLRPIPVSDTTYLATTGGPPRPYVSAGAIRFNAGGRENELTVYRATGDDDRGQLFVPFTDATSGEETYGGGRYLDLQPTATGSYVVDFNRSYHPYCVYDPSYVCPVPPEANRLRVRVTAGERLPASG
jgi:uncharacterized protein (DUF1684 family)